MSDEIYEKLTKIYYILQTAFNGERSHYHYILLDRKAEVSELSLLYSEALEDEIAPELLSFLERPELRQGADSCPLLVCICEPDGLINEDLLLASLAQIGEEYLTSKLYVCGYLSSPLSPKQLASHLLKSCYYAGKATQQKYLPFYEPFLLELIWHSYEKPAAHLGVLLPKDSHYYFVDSDLNCQQFCAVDYQDESDFILRFANPKMSILLKDSAVLKDLLMDWYDICKQQGRTLPPKSLSQILHYFYDKHGKRFITYEDRVLYVLFSLQYGDLSLHPTFTDIINDVINHDDKKGKLSYFLNKEVEALKALKNL